MLELMLNISDYQPWLKSMLSLADERNRGVCISGCFGCDVDEFNFSCIVGSCHAQLNRLSAVKPRKLPTIQNLPTKDGIDQDYLQILDCF